MLFTPHPDAPHLSMLNAGTFSASLIDDLPVASRLNIAPDKISIWNDRYGHCARQLCPVEKLCLLASSPNAISRPHLDNYIKHGVRAKLYFRKYLRHHLSLSECDELAQRFWANIEWSTGSAPSRIATCAQNSVVWPEDESLIGGSFGWADSNEGYHLWCSVSDLLRAIQYEYEYDEIPHHLEVIEQHLTLSPINEEIWA